MTLPHNPNLVSTSELLCRPPARPPTGVKRREHQTALQAALAGGMLQLVGTDHAVFNSTQKRVGRHDFRIIPNGVNGLEVNWVLF